MLGRRMFLLLLLQLDSEIELFFYYIKNRKNHLLSRLHGIQRELMNGLNPFLEDLQKRLWHDYEVVLFEEEAFWAQKARSHWLAQGDHG